ncbi:MAG: nuclear transport factor 2 family protein [Gemmatimonadetes bacterium]|nr:nuclear transport factor 2 family protein [Gemmatimonadota bacterium]
MVARLAVALCLLWIAPLHGQANDPANAGGQPSVELPDPLERVLRDYERHWSGGDADALAELFVDQGLIVSGGNWIRGRAAIREAYQIASGPLRLRAIEYSTDGSVGYIVGAYGYGDELPVADAGLFTLTLRRDSQGRWLIVSDMDRGAIGGP